MDKYALALEEINEELNENGIWHCATSRELLQELVERALPKKVIHIDEDFHMFVCPNRECRSTIQCTDDYDHKYCLECGQALDWSDYQFNKKS